MRTKASSSRPKCCPHQPIVPPLDPESVTVFSESSGAFSTDAVLTSFLSDSTPPLRAAGLESGPNQLPRQPVSQESFTLIEDPHGIHWPPV